jgi:hypothetical protein
MRKINMKKNEMLRIKILGEKNQVQNLIDCLEKSYLIFPTSDLIQTEDGSHLQYISLVAKSEVHTK